MEETRGRFIIRPVRYGLLPLLLSLFCTMAGEAQERTLPRTCTYEESRWNVELRRSVGPLAVRHPYSETTAEEIDPATGCTVCREDQKQVSVPPLAPFLLCYTIAPMVQRTLETLVRRGEPLFTVQGYRVIRSRGPIDEQGNRTVFSNHSFGTALDINRDLNGLYDRCMQFGPECRLLLGGHWRPGVPGTLEQGGAMVRALTALGLRWGGVMQGRQKDFMHFSYTGY